MFFTSDHVDHGIYKRNNSHCDERCYFMKYFIKLLPPNVDYTIVKTSIIHDLSLIFICRDEGSNNLSVARLDVNVSAQKIHAKS